MDQETGVTRVKVNTPSSPRPDDRSIAEIRQNIENTRKEITDTVDLISDKFKHTFDWKAYVSDYPLVAVGGATVIGFFLARKLFATKKRSDTDVLLQNLINNAVTALKPPKKSIIATVGALGAKYAFDQYQKYQEEKNRELELQQQMEQLQALQMMQHQQMSQRTGGIYTGHSDLSDTEL
jgi:hypothetical protein